MKVSILEHLAHEQFEHVRQIYDDLLQIERVGSYYVTRLLAEVKDGIERPINR